MEEKNNYFGTDGIRGIVGEELSLDFFVFVGKSLSLLDCKELLVGTDTRKTKDIVRYGVIAGALSVGISVQFVSIVSTPMLIYETIRQNCFGVMITASHNPEEYNGIKIINHGHKISKEEQDKINDYLNLPYELLYHLGEYKEDFTFYKSYISYIKNLMKPTHLHLAIDCANGACAPFIKEVFLGSGIEVEYTGIDKHGKINDSVGATHMEHIQSLVLEKHCDLGFAFDGDGDRVLAVDKDGNRIDGDKLIYAFARYLKKHSLLKQNQVVLTILSNPGIVEALEECGIMVTQSDVGDQNVGLCMEFNGIVLGGEKSGHIILSDFFPSGDGLLTAVLFLNMIQEENLDLKELSNIPLYSCRTLNLAVYPQDLKGYEDKIRMVEEQCISGEKIILRKSGTEHVLRITVFAKTDVRANTFLEEVKQILMV